MEMRGADAGLIDRVAQVPAFWVGLLYDEPSLNAAWELVKDWTAEERQGLRDRVPQTALATPFRRTTVRDIARKALDLAKGGLERRAKLSGQGQTEAMYLQSVEAIVDRGCTQAEDLLGDFTGRWNGDVREVFKARRY
jgi:glutamate--cysteine ligase